MNSIMLAVNQYLKENNISSSFNDDEITISNSRYNLKYHDGFIYVYTINDDHFIFDEIDVNDPQSLDKILEIVKQ